GLSFELLRSRPMGLADEADLLLNIVGSGQNLLCEMDYNANLFNSATIEQMLRHFQTLASQIATSPEMKLGELTEVLAETDRKRMLEEERVLEQTSLKTLKGTRRKSVSGRKAEAG